MANIAADWQRRLATEKLLSNDAGRLFRCGLGDGEGFGRSGGGAVDLGLRDAGG